MTIKDFIAYARTKIGQQYRITWSDGKTETRTLKAVTSRGALISAEHYIGANLCRKNCSISDDGVLSRFSPTLRWTETEVVTDWDNRLLCYTVKFID